MKIKMLQTIRPDFPLDILKPDAVLREGMTYEAIISDKGAVSGICANGNIIGVKRGEFARICPLCGSAYTGSPAISRKDNREQICPDCGLREALEAWGLPPTAQKAVIFAAKSARRGGTKECTTTKPARSATGG